MLNKSLLSLSVALAAGIFSMSVQAINPNTATVEQLADSLVGVGPKLAEKIVQYRDENGEFQSLEDLMEVKGIGTSVIDKNRDQIELAE